MTKDFFQLQNNHYGKPINTTTNPYHPIVKLHGFINGKRFFYSQKGPRTFRTNVYNTTASKRRHKNKKRFHLRRTKKREVK